jgi:hypothetical protein
MQFFRDGLHELKQGNVMTVIKAVLVKILIYCLASLCSYGLMKRLNLLYNVCKASAYKMK